MCKFYDSERDHTQTKIQISFYVVHLIHYPCHSVYALMIVIIHRSIISSNDLRMFLLLLPLSFIPSRFQCVLVRYCVLLFLWSMLQSVKMHLCVCVCVCDVVSAAATDVFVLVSGLSFAGDYALQTLTSMYKVQLQYTRPSVRDKIKTRYLCMWYAMLRGKKHTISTV